MLFYDIQVFIHIVITNFLMFFLIREKESGVFNK